MQIVAVFSLVLCVLAFSWIGLGQQVLPQQPFHVDISGTFNYSGAADCPFCSQCNNTAPAGCSTWQFRGPTYVTCTGGVGPFNDEAEQRWGSCASGSGTPCNCGLPGSGIGFEGYKNLTMITNPTNNGTTRIGRITHYNNGINSLGINQPRRLRLTLNLASPQLPGGNTFTVQYLLNFFETPNSQAGGVPCDFSIQISPQQCDDIFWFGSTRTAATFQVNNVKYTLDLAGFKRTQTGGAVQRFITPEYHVNTAYLYASIVTVCEVTPCPKGRVFLPFPTCGCSCPLTDATCQNAFGPDWALDHKKCACYCAVNTTAQEQAICQQEFPGATSGPETIFNPDRCGCGCTLNNTYCQSISPNYEVAPPSLPCECSCNKQYLLDCVAFYGPFYTAAGNFCECVCVVSDSICSAKFGNGYTADYSQCGCIAPSSGGLSNGAIAGIVIGAVAGAVLLVLAILALLGLLVFLILKGIIPGIYGYKIEPADVSTMQTSPMYKDTWSTSNPMSS